MSERSVENGALPACAGHSARGECTSAIRYVVSTGPGRRAACGRHIGWLLGRLLTADETAEVTRVALPDQDPTP